MLKLLEDILTKNPSPKVTGSLERLAEARGQLSARRGDLQAQQAALGTSLEEAVKLEAWVGKVSTRRADLLVKLATGQAVKEDAAQAARDEQEARVKLAEISERLNALQSAIPGTAAGFRISQTNWEFQLKATTATIWEELKAAIIPPDTIRTVNLLIELLPSTGRHGVWAENFYAEVLKPSDKQRKEIHQEAGALRQYLVNVGEEPDGALR